MMRILPALVLIPSVLLAQPQDDAVVAIVSVRVAELWDAEHFRPAREILDDEAGRFRTRMVHITGYAPAEIDRVTFIIHRLSGHEEEQVAPIVVVVPRRPLTYEAIAGRVGRSVKRKPGDWKELPEFALFEGEPLMAVCGGTVVLVPFAVPEDHSGQAAFAERIAMALKRDDDRNRQMRAAKLAGSAAVSGQEAFRYFGGGVDEEGLPRELPSEIKPLDGARFAAFELSIDRSLKLACEIKLGPANDPARSAAALELVLKRLVRLLDQPESMPDQYRELKSAAKALLTAASVKRKEGSLELQASLPATPELAKAIGSAIAAWEIEAAKLLSYRNLTRLATAAYASLNIENAPLIANICNDQGKPLLSWRVGLLKSLGHEELYNQFKLDEPWDSEHNKALIPKMPKVFVLPTAKPAKEGFTFYQSFSGKKGAMVRPMLRDGDERGLTLQEIADGTGTTLLIVEAAEAVEWTKPVDIPFDPDGPAPRLGGHFPKTWNAVFADATARSMRSDLDEKKLKAFITANGGEEITIDD